MLTISTARIDSSPLARFQIRNSSVSQIREGFTARNPPSITNSYPFIYPAAGDAARCASVLTISTARIDSSPSARFQIRNPSIAQIREWFTARNPPSITNSCPFIYPAAGDARYTAVPAISVGALYTKIKSVLGHGRTSEGTLNPPTYIPGLLAGTDTTGMAIASVAS